MDIIVRKVETTEQIENLVSLIASSPRAGVDTETLGLDPRADKLRLITISLPNDLEVVYVIDCFQIDPTPIVTALMKTRTVYHNALFDTQFLAQYGFAPSGKISDTYLYSLLLDSPDKPKGHHTLAQCVLRELSVILPKELQRSDWAHELSDAQIEYAARDAAVLLSLAKKLEDKLVEAKMAKVAGIELAAFPFFWWMSMSGVPVDVDRWNVLTRKAEKEIQRLTEEMEQYAPPRHQLSFFEMDGEQEEGWNLNLHYDWESLMKVKRAFKRLGFVIENTNDWTLARINHPLAELMREYRSQQKLVSTYGDEWILQTKSDGRVYPNWRQIGAISGRVASSNPNLMNLPRDEAYRACFRPKDGNMFVVCDYSQIELRISAQITQDPMLIKAYKDGEDIHIVTARNLTKKKEISKNDRQISKSANFGLLYGMSAEKLVNYAYVNYGVNMTLEEAEDIKNRFFTLYKGLKRWHQRVGNDTNPEVRTLAGRRYIGKIEYFNQRLNTPVQGTGADGAKAAMGLLWKRRNEVSDAVKPVIMVHDELVIECPAAEAEHVKDWLERGMIDGMQPLLPDVPVEAEAFIADEWKKG